MIARQILDALFLATVLASPAVAGKNAQLTVLDALLALNDTMHQANDGGHLYGEIGRASCRERV